MLEMSLKQTLMPSALLQFHYKCVCAISWFYTTSYKPQIFAGLWLFNIYLYSNYITSLVNLYFLGKMFQKSK